MPPTFLPPFLRRITSVLILTLLAANHVCAEETLLEFSSKPVFFKDDQAVASVEPGSTPGSQILKYDFTNGGEFVQFQLPIAPLEEQFSQLEITLKGSEEVVSFNVRGTDKQAVGTRIGPLSGEEQTITVDLKKVISENAKTGKALAYPIGIIGFMLRSPKEPQGSIEVIKVTAKTE